MGKLNRTHRAGLLTALLGLGFYALAFGACGIGGESHGHSQCGIFAGRPSISVSVDYQQGDFLSVSAMGLEPARVYTLWLVNEAPEESMAGLGIAPYAFTADVSGEGTFNAKITEQELAKWQILKIVLHKDGDARNMAKTNLAGVFTVSTDNILRAQDKEAAVESNNRQ